MVSKLYICLCIHYTWLASCMFVCMSVRGAEHKVDSDLARSISQFCEDIPVGVDELFKVRPFLLTQNYFLSSQKMSALACFTVSVGIVLYYQMYLFMTYRQFVHVDVFV